MPSAITDFTSGHSAAGEPRRSAVVSIQIMSPWAPESSHCRSRAADRGAASARATPTAVKPTVLASRSNPALSSCLRLPSMPRCRYHIESVGGRQKMAAGPAIEAKGLFKAFDGKPAVDGISLAVPEGTIYGILGPNGAGKTTTLCMLLGIINPDRGHRTLLGHERPLERSEEHTS